MKAFLGAPVQVFDMLLIHNFSKEYISTLNYPQIVMKAFFQSLRNALESGKFIM